MYLDDKYDMDDPEHIIARISELIAAACGIEVWEVKIHIIHVLQATAHPPIDRQFMKRMNKRLNHRG